MIKISKMSDYAMMMMVRIYQDKQQRYNVVQLSELTGLQKPTVTKLLKLLTKAGLLESFRGKVGGYQACHEAEDISIHDIIVAIDGPIALTQCLEDKDCQYLQSCSLQMQWQQLNHNIEDILIATSLQSMINDQQTAYITEAG
jgi:FeS assembly SUF system regulator